MTDQNPRQSLPQTPQPFSFSSAPSSERREPQKNYVFVDEKNRHRRLKVVRACEGCRKRKIKCDAANTNTWPCSACVRMKMNCVPPTLSFEHDDSTEYESEPSQTSSFQSTPSADLSSMQGSPTTLSSQTSLRDSSPAEQGRAVLGPSSLVMPIAPAFGNLPFEPEGISHFAAQDPRYAPRSTSSSASTAASLSPDVDWMSETSDAELTEALGDLKISDVAVAQYMVNQKGLAEFPAVQEEEVSLPQQRGPGLTVRIPDEMMPSDQTALQYFRYFFNNIHPYVPVIYPPYFYRQWHQGKASISPLILEGIFACSTNLMEQKHESNQWLALASKHEESFKDVPRLSTLQGLLLLLKAREAVPKRGYYYRSWMMVVNMVAMAKDLGLDTHYELHEAGRACGSPDHECIVKTRVWHSLYVVELMIGGPQGRTDYGVRSESVDFDGLTPSQGLDDQEQQIDQQFAQFMRVIRNIRETSRIYVNLRNRKTDWALDPDFVEHNSAFDSWLKDLPHHLEISFPPGGVAPWIPFHFVANVHCYHKLSIIMHHRPQIQQSTSGSFDGSWKRHMMICYQAAKEMCRLQEAVIQQFGLAGLLCMQRGISFSIYSILTCTMLHLVAVTSPDTEINHGAAEFFVRHMRILEQCTPSWPMKEMQMQIESLRQAFSADVNRPFELRPNFPGSPPRSDRSSPPFGDQRFASQPYLPTPAEELPLTYAPLTPPRSAAAGYPTSELVSAPVLGGDDYGGESSVMQSVEQQETYWNPSRIFDQWNTAFGMPAASTSTPDSVTNVVTSTSATASGAHLTSQALHRSTQYPDYSQSGPAVPNYVGSLPNPQTAWTSPPQPYVTPSMWQHAVASTYGEGLKRRWNDTPISMTNRDTKRAR